ncbi:MAG: hypothetical protein J7L99_07230 [Planctomycetes bacterium]|nr:hypothetical protein [Planctomycetota bacterium]
MMLWKESVYKYQQLLWIFVLTTDGHHYFVNRKLQRGIVKKEGGKK